ncbi:MAG: cytochrome P450 [Rhodospirillaceae bacterium]|nr:MAG: cytochrome P450 [Rhodospirillaceae bacterium]
MRVTETFAQAREVLRNGALKEVIPGIDRFKAEDPTKVPVIFLDGEIHRRRRAAIARFFTPKAIATRYRAVMEECSNRLLHQMQAKGGGHLDRISFQLAVTVAATIVGLTNSDQAGLASRIKVTLASGLVQKSHWAAKLVAELIRRCHALNFFIRDVRPAIAARRKQRQEDVISHLLDEGYSDTAILIECMTYAAAGMMTTREFIVMAAWHLFGNEALLQRFLTGDEADQFAILEEILRLEPIASVLHRHADEDIELPEAGPIPADTVFAIDIRAANTDEEATGPCPYAIDPDRAKQMKGIGSFMSFGDGAHRCPGAQVALHETRVFLDRLFRVPGIRLEREPDMRWCEELTSYELRNAMIACDRT